MRKMISSPSEMPLSEVENQIYQKALSLFPDVLLNLMAVKVNDYPKDFTTWCAQLNQICSQEINFDLLEDNQLPILKKLEGILQAGVSVSQLKMLRVSPWPIFSGFILQNATVQALQERIALLDYISNLKDKPLAQLIEEDKLAFAGKHSSLHDIGIYKFDVEWFASTKGAKIFHQLLQDCPQDFDEALAYISLSGEVSKGDYQKFVKAYSAIFTRYEEGTQAPLMPATRLLAMRRPDQFIALTNNKVDVICQGFNIVKLNNRSFNDYWEDLILTLRVMPWWNAKEPLLSQNKPEVEVINKETGSSLNEPISEESSEPEQQEVTTDISDNKLWQYRAALVDVFLFANEETALKSNYQRLLHKSEQKAKNSTRTVVRKALSSSGATRRKYTKESAESLVDKALANEELPAYLKDKRESILKAVKEGKSVDHVIKMMRAIFG